VSKVGWPYSEDRLKELDMVTLEERRHQLDMAQVYKLLSGKDRADAAQLLQTVNSDGVTTRGTADPLNLVQKRSRLELRSHFFTHRVTESWNKIPANLKRAQTVGAFKKGYKNIRSGLVPDV